MGIGSGMPFFNRHTASLTRFRQLAPIPEGSSAPPPVLVLHGRYGGCIGDMASYDLFMLGGPHSVRGFNIGELAASRSFLEGAVEIRVSFLSFILCACVCSLLGCAIPQILRERIRFQPLKSTSYFWQQMELSNYSGTL